MRSKEEISRYQKEWRCKNIKRISKREKLYRLKNKEKIAQREKAYSQKPKNKERRRIYTKKYNKINKERIKKYFRKNWKRLQASQLERFPEKIAAGRVLRDAVKREKIKKPSNCFLCKLRFPQYKLHGHHEDYSKPLRVKWVCMKCHKKIHKRIEREAKK